MLPQVTVYEDSDLFDSSECEDGAPGATGEVMTPIISVTDNANGRENITIIFHGVQVYKSMYPWSRQREGES